MSGKKRQTLDCFTLKGLYRLNRKKEKIFRLDPTCCGLLARPSAYEENISSAPKILCVKFQPLLLITCLKELFNEIIA